MLGGACVETAAPEGSKKLRYVQPRIHTHNARELPITIDTIPYGTSIVSMLLPRPPLLPLNSPQERGGGGSGGGEGGSICGG